MSTDDTLEESPDLEGIEEDGDGPTVEFRGGKWMSAVPIVFFIVWAIVQSALFRVGDTTGLAAGMLIGLIIGMLFVRGDWADYANTIFEGMSQPVAVTAVVAWLWAGMFAATIQAGGFVEGLVWLADAVGVEGALFVGITFLLAGLLATGIGTGYGTTVAFVTLFFPAGGLLGANPTLLFGAILSGAVFGDNLAPVSDTTIISAVTQDADIGGVVASRFKYALIAAVPAFVLFVAAGSAMAGIDVAGDAREIFVGLAAVSKMLVFRIPTDAPVGDVSFLPVVETATEASEVGVGGSIYSGAAGFFAISILILLIIGGVWIMVRGGAFDALLEWVLESIATTVRRTELSMVGSVALINAAITINTAAEIAIAPYVARLGERFNVNAYRRANILDANTAALGYIFPWSGGVLVGFEAIRTQVLPEYEWFTAAMVVNPADVFPYVFHGWLLVAVFVIAAWTGFGREYTIDRVPDEVTTL
ncbi:sodium:proton antiporter [Halobacteriales archaeon QH_7_69_31]|nr:MAG: sodium:proton antiporter [Halobacteriales archaeon QH_7_69_31]